MGLANPGPSFMVTAVTNDRMDVIESLVNVWLKDNTFYCNYCGANYVKGMPPCCEDPQIGTNSQHAMALVIENDLRRKELKYETGASKQKTMRVAFSLPPRLYQFIKSYFSRYNENFPKDRKELYRLMRRYKRFCIPQKI